MSKIRELLRVTDEDVEKVRTLYNKAEKNIEEDLLILLEWLSKQQHLPKPHDKNRLERFLVRNKFRMEQTKTKLDNYYTFKVLYPEFYRHWDPACDVQQTARKCCVAAPMPKLLPNANRLVVCQFAKDQDDNFNVIHLMEQLFLFCELQLLHDYSAGDVYIWDFKHLTFKYVVKMDVNEIQKSLVLFQQAFCGRLSRLEYVNLPPWFDVVLKMLKMALNAKLFGKIRLHKDLDSLHEAIPKEYLPRELGGYGESIHDISDKWKEELIFQKDFFREQAKMTSNEKLRVGKPVWNELFGTDGTFRKINLD